MTSAIASLLAWAKRNERWLSSLFFLAGFVGDIATFTLLEVSVVNLIFAGYLVVGGAAILLTHHLFSHLKEEGSMLRRGLMVLLPLFVQYAIGSILSGSLVFYAKSATLLVSWPFLLLLAVVFFGNEIFRGYREHLAFQTTLFFFGFYAYVIFALPLALGSLGPPIFLASSGIAVTVFALFLVLLYRAGAMRLRESFKAVILGSLAIVLAMNVAYFTGIIPPLPLGLKDAGVYHHIERTGAGYRLGGEPQAPWYRFYEEEIVRHVPGTPLYVYSAVFAPIRFSARVEHVWERYNPDTKTWQVMNRVSFPVSGGRAEGYRGYSEKADPMPGRWRVSIKTGEGQTIGRIGFTVVSVNAEPPLEEAVR